MIRTTKYFDSSSNQALLPPTIYRKPVRIVKAVQRSVPSSSSANDFKTTFSTKMNSENDLKSLSMHYLNNEYHLSSEYIRDLFPIPDYVKRNRSRQNSATNSQTPSNENTPQAVRIN